MNFETDYKGRFGIELEFTAYTRQLVGPNGSFHDHVWKLCEQSGLPNWQIKKDGSCGHELVSPKLQGQNGLNILMEICMLCQRAAKDFEQERIVGFDTGVHYHFDASHYDYRFLRNIVVIMAAIEPLILLMNPRERNNLCYAGPMNINLYQMIRARDEIDLTEQWFRHYNGNPVANSHQGNYGVKFWNGSGKNPHKYDYTRYHGFNLVAYWHHRTVEFRYTHGTFNQEIIYEYFRIYHKIVEAAASMKMADIMSVYPYKRNDVKTLSMEEFQMNLIADMPKLLAFTGAIIKPDVKTWKFIANRLFKNNWQNINLDFINMILSFPDDGDAKELGRKIRNFGSVGRCVGYRFRANKAPGGAFDGPIPEAAIEG
jgi:hypothetical protein